LRAPPRQRTLEREGLAPGTPAPRIELRRVDGGTLTLEEYRGRRVLLVFSDPDCGPCNELAPHLERIHRTQSDLDVVMISRHAERTRAKIAEHGLTFPVALQRRWEISREFDMLAFPVAYVIDEEGTIASTVAVGIGAILALASDGESVARDRIRARIESLQAELEKGQAELDRIERRRSYLHETMLRIAGAIEVLEELDRAEALATNGATPTEVT
jgi:peroxiredoxin